MPKRPQAKKSQGAPGAQWKSGGILRALLLGLLVLAAAALPYLQTVHFGFVWDDRALIGPHLDVRGPEDVARIWRTPFDSLLRDNVLQRTFFRPGVLYSLAADRALHGDAPSGYHTMNLLWHALACLFLWLLAWEISGLPLAATAGAVLFALHPSHPESVAFLSGRTDLIAGALLFASLWIAARWGRRPGPAWRKLLPASAALLPALFSKEVALFAAPLLPLALWLADRRSSPRAVAAAAVPVLGVALLYLACRAGVLGLRPLPAVTPVEGALPQLWTSGLVVADYLALLLAPLGLSAWHEVPHLEAPTPAALAGLLSAAAMLVLLVMALRRRSAWSLPVALLTATLLPVCWVRILSGSLVSERLLYIPGGALALAVALLPRAWAGVKARTGDAGPAFLGACALGAVVYLALLLPRVPVWRDEGTLYGSMLRDSPNSPFVHAALGGYHYQRRDLPRAAQHHRRAYELQPKYTDALLNLAAAQEEMGQVDSALVSVRELLRVRGDYAAAWYALGNLEVRSDRLDSARVAYGRALSLLPAFAEAENNLGVALERMGRPAEAMAHYRRALEIRPGYPEAGNNLSRLAVDSARAGAGPARAGDAPGRRP